MNEQQFEVALGRLKVVGSACYGFLCPEDIRAVALRVAPQVQETDLERLTEACRAFHQVVDSAEKEAVLARAREKREAERAKVRTEAPDFEPPLPDAPAVDREPLRKPVAVDPAFGDRVLGILLLQETDSEARKLWQAVAERNPRYRTILEMRPDSDAETVAKALGVEPEVLYGLELEIIRAYYGCAELTWRQRR